MAADIHRAHGGFDNRRRLERECAEYAGLGHKWHVLLWIPARNMRMKAAAVLVDDGDRVLPLEAYDRHGARRGSEIYDAHEDLWAVSVFVHRSVGQEQCAVIRAFLSQRIGVKWAASVDAGPDELVQLAASRVSRELKLSRDAEQELTGSIAAYSPSRASSTFADLVSQLTDIAQERWPATAIAPDEKQERLDL
jgi:hypothetical protein